MFSLNNLTSFNKYPNGCLTNNFKYLSTKVPIRRHFKWTVKPLMYILFNKF